MAEDEELTKAKQQTTESKSGDFGNTVEKGKGVEQSRGKVQQKSSELEVFSAAINSETKKMQESLSELQTFLRQMVTPLAESSIQTEGKQSGEIKQLCDETLKQAGDLASLDKQFKEQAEARLEKLQALEMQTTEDVNSFRILVTEVKEILTSLYEYAARLPLLKEQANKVYEAYKLARVKEQGYESMEDLRSGYYRKRDEERQLRNSLLGAGRWFKKKAIADLKAEAGRMKDVTDLAYSNVSVPGQYSDSRYEIGKLAEKFVTQTVNRLTQRYDSLLKENSEVLPEGKIEVLTQEEIASLKEDDIQQEVLPRIEKEKEQYRRLIENYHSEYKAHLAELEDPEQVAHFTDLVKRCSKEPLGSYQSDPAEESRLQALQQEIENLPKAFHQISGYFIYRDGKPQDQQFQELGNFSATSKDWGKQDVVRQAYLEILSGLKQLNQEEIKTAGYYIDSIIWDVERKIRGLQSSEEGKNRERFLFDYDINRWEIFKNNQKIRQRFGPENIDELDQQLGQHIKNLIINLDEHSDPCIKLGYKLYHYKEAEYVPLAILNAYREVGYSGEMPFLSFHTDSSNETVLYKYLASLDPAEMQKLKSFNIPGCNELIDLVLANSTNFSRPGLYNHETGDRKDNPAFHQIQQHLTEMSVHFLKHGDHKMDFYLAGLLDNTEGDLGEGYGLLLNILTSKADARTKDTVLKCAITRIRGKDEKAALVLLGAYDQLSDDVKETIGKKAGELIWGMARREGEITSQILEGLSQVTGKTTGEVNQLINFLREQYAASFFSENITNENISNYFEIATNPELCGFIRELQPHGYVFRVEHLPYMPEMLKNKDRFFAEIEDIKRYKPDFKYDLAYDFDYDAEKRESRQVFYTNPYEIFAERHGAQQILEILKNYSDQENASKVEHAQIPRNFSDAILMRLRRNDNASLRERLAERKTFTEEEAVAFQQALTNLQETFDSLEGGKSAKANFYEYCFPQRGGYPFALTFIARSPQRYQEIKKVFESAAQPLLNNLTNDKHPLNKYCHEVYNGLHTYDSLEMGFTTPILLSLRKNDPLLKDKQFSPEELSKVEAEFNTGILQLLSAVEKQGGDSKSFLQEVYLSEPVLQFCSRRPDRVPELIDLPKNAPRLFELMQVGGPLYTNRENVMKHIFGNGDFLRRAHEIETIFTQKVPYWKQLCMFTESRIGDKLAAATSGYPVSEVAGIPLGNIVRRHIQAKDKNLAGVTTLEQMIADPIVVEQLVTGAATDVTFSQLTGIYKKLVFRDYLQKTIETSRSELAKANADARNRLLAADPFAVVPDTYIHGSRVDFIDSVMLNGNLPQEALGESAGTDSYPFQVDFTKLKADYLAQQKSIPDIFNNSLSKNYGSGGPLGADGQIFYIYDRSKAGWEAGKDYTTTVGGDHALILGGMPSTEVTGIVLRNADITLPKVREAILEQGCYIPIYNIEGKFLMTPEEYDQVRLNNNMKVPVEVWDYTLKTGGQLGSNVGGEFTVPEKGGPVKYYVKFSRGGSTEQLWNEQLSDNFYRALGLDVPVTKVVKVEGSFGHASRLITGHEPNLDEYHTQLKSGFIMDCLLANWDVAAKTDNVKVDDQTGRLSRIDNGGALLFRAQGERKPNFSDVVTELETMRNSYPGLNPDDITEQLAKLREIFTDETINQRVDGVRLSQQDRDVLKATLRGRRDYIISYFEGSVAADTEQLTDEGREIPQLLRTGEIDDKRLAALVPEWDRLNSEAGYQHNGVLLGGHLKEAISTLHTLPEYQQLNPKEQDLATVATLFHDIAKPTETKNEQVVRDFSHEIPSAQLAANYMQKWGYSRGDIRTVVQAILYDGVVSDIARGKVRDESKNLTPEQLRAQLNDPSVIRILRALNHADVVATVGESGYGAIEQVYNEYFEKVK